MARRPLSRPDDGNAEIDTLAAIRRSMKENRPEALET